MFGSGKNSGSNGSDAEGLEQTWATTRERLERDIDAGVDPAEALEESRPLYQD